MQPAIRRLTACLAALCAVAHAQLNRGQQEEFLRTAKLVRSQPTKKGVTQSMRVTLTDGRVTHDAHFQSVDTVKGEFRTDRGVEVGFKDSYKFNIAAYRLDKLLGLGMVPVSIERSIGGSHGALTWWVDDVLGDEHDRQRGKFRIPDPAAYNRQVYTQRVFTQLVFNSDPNMGNFLTDRNYDLWIIDFTRAFRLFKTLPAPLDLVGCDRRLLAALRGLDSETLTRELHDYLTKSERNALLARRDLILKHFESKGAPALFDMHRKTRDSILKP